VRPLPYPVILASASPRRSDLLKPLIPEFRVIPADVDEDGLTDSDPWITARKLAREKALAVFEAHPDSLVIGGDTVVAYQNGDAWVQLAKPADEDDAFRMLSILSGRTHTVITGICIKWPKGFSSFTDESKVTFAKMSDEQIRAYIATGEPMDKAGAYGLQGGARPFITQVEGFVSTVIGLPTERLSEALRDVD